MLAAVTARVCSRPCSPDPYPVFASDTSPNSCPTCCVWWRSQKLWGTGRIEHLEAQLPAIKVPPARVHSARQDPRNLCVCFGRWWRV